MSRPNSWWVASDCSGHPGQYTSSLLNKVHDVQVKTLSGRTINLPNWLIPYWGRTTPLLPRYTWRSCFSLHNLHPEKLIFFFNIMLFLKTLTWLFQMRRQQGRRWGALHRESWSAIWRAGEMSDVCFQNDNDHLPGCRDDVSDCCSYFLPSEANGALVNDGRDVNGRAEPLFNRSNRVISLFSSCWIEKLFIACYLRRNIFRRGFKVVLSALSCHFFKKWIPCFYPAVDQIPVRISVLLWWFAGEIISNP